MRPYRATLPEWAKEDTKAEPVMMGVYMAEQYPLLVANVVQEKSVLAEAPEASFYVQADFCSQG